MSSHSVATYLTFKQEAKVGSERTVYPNDGIAKWDWNLANDALV